MKDLLQIIAEHFILKGICETLDTNYYVSKEEIFDYASKILEICDLINIAHSKIGVFNMLSELVQIMKQFIPVADAIIIDEGIAIYYFTGYVDYEEDER